MFGLKNQDEVQNLLSQPEDQNALAQMQPKDDQYRQMHDDLMNQPDPTTKP